MERRNTFAESDKTFRKELSPGVLVATDFILKDTTQTDSLLTSNLYKSAHDSIEEHGKKLPAEAVKCGRQLVVSQAKPTIIAASTTHLVLPSTFKISHRKNKCNSNKVLKLFTKLFRHVTALITIVAADNPIVVSHRNGKDSRTWRYKISPRTRFRLLPSVGATSFLTILTLVCLETVLLSTVTNCAKTFYMHWNTSNSIFRIDNTDHIIDVNKGNLAFEFDQVHIICPVYEPGTFENETEKYIIYNVSKVEYETCRITNADPRVIAICDKPQKLMFFTITFRPFTPQPGGLEFLPGNDYYFISTSSKDDLYRRIGGRCSTNNMKVVFKVCCAPEEKNKTTSNIGTVGGSSGGRSGVDASDTISAVSGDGETINTEVITATNTNHPHYINNINTIGMNGLNTIPATGININSGNSNNIQLKGMNSPTSTSINTNIDQFNRIPIQTNGLSVMGNNFGNVGLGNHGTSGIMLTPGHNSINMIPTVGGGVLQFPGHHPGQTGIRINNVPPQHNYPSHKNNMNDDHYDKHPNEVVKNEELTYNSASSSLHQYYGWKLASCEFIKSPFTSMISHISRLTGGSTNVKNNQSKNLREEMGTIKGRMNLNIKPIILFSIFFTTAAHCISNNNWYSFFRIVSSISCTITVELAKPPFYQRLYYIISFKNLRKLTQGLR